MKELFMLYWRSTDGTSGCVLVSVLQTDPQKFKTVVELGMSKAIAIHSTAEFYKLEQLPELLGVLWTGEYL